MPSVHKNGKKISKYLLKKAKEVKPYVDKYSQKEQIPIEFIFAIIHSESSFNPLSRSYVPAFGLMQIVPTTAGADAMQYISGKKLF
jgi:membrane-bound lytic murein transglycosylase C